MTLFIFLLVDSFIFEYLVLILFRSVAYNPQLVSLLGIPLIVIIGWTVLLYTHLKLTKSALLTAISMTGIDLIIEFPAIKIGFWHWNEPSGLFGVPYKNFFAWYFYSLLIAHFVPRNSYPASLIKITLIGLVVGFWWNSLPLGIQKYLFWAIFISSSIYLFYKHTRKHNFLSSLFLRNKPIHDLNSD